MTQPQYVLWFLVGTFFMLHPSPLHAATDLGLGVYRFKRTPTQGMRWSPTPPPAPTLSYVPSCSSGSPLFPDCLFFKLNYANTSQPSIHRNHISCIPQPVFWQKKPIQVTTTNKDKWQEGFPGEHWAIGLCQCGPIFSALLCGWGEGVEWQGTAGKAFSS